MNELSRQEEDLFMACTKAFIADSESSETVMIKFDDDPEDHRGIGFVTIIPLIGLSVIFDIDDTIKITQIPDGESLVLKNTFFRPYTSVPCMAQMYKLFGEGAAFLADFSNNG